MRRKKLLQRQKSKKSHELLSAESELEWKYCLDLSVALFVELDAKLEEISINTWYYSPTCTEVVADDEGAMVNVPLKVTNHGIT